MGDQRRDPQLVTENAPDDAPVGPTRHGHAAWRPDGAEMGKPILSPSVIDIRGRFAEVKPAPPPRHQRLMIPSHDPVAVLATLVECADLPIEERLRLFDWLLEEHPAAIHNV